MSDDEFTLEALTAEARSAALEGNYDRAYQLMTWAASVLIESGMGAEALRVLKDLRQSVPRHQQVGTRHAWLLNDEGLALTGVGKDRQAQRKFAAMLRVGERLDDSAIQATAHQNLSLSALRLGDLDGATVHAAAALAAHFVAENWFGLLQTRLNTVTMKLEEQDLDTAEEFLDSLEESLRLMRHPGLNATFAGLRGLVAAKRGMSLEAETAYRTALRYSRRANDPHKIIASQMNIGLVKVERGDFASGLSWLRRALGSANELEDTPKQEEVHQALASSLFSANRFADALHQYDEALELAKRRGDLLAANKHEAGRGAALTALGRYDEAHRVLTRALPNLERVSDVTWQVTVLRNLAVAAAALEDRDDEQRYLSSAISIASELDWHLRADLYRQLAEAYLADRTTTKMAEESLQQELATVREAARRKTGSMTEFAWRAATAGALLRAAAQSEAAISFYSIAVRAFSRLKDAQLLFHSRNDRALAYIDVGMTAAARSDLRACLALADRHSDRAMEQRAVFNMAELDRRRKYLSTARRLFERSRSLARDLGDLEAEADSLISLGDILEEEENVVQARVQFERALALVAGKHLEAVQARATAGLAGLSFVEQNFREAARLYATAARLSARQQGVHHVERLAALLESLAADQASSRRIETAAQNLVATGQAEQQEGAASTGLWRSARWLISGRRTLAVELYVSAILLELVAASFSLETQEDIERFSRALMRPIIALVFHATELGDDGERLLTDVLKAIQQDYPDVAPTIEQAIAEARHVNHT
jgi:tetratricopeptide (TPR) repeat protein